MNIIQATTAFFSNYATFRTRATRSEFWWAMLGTIILSIIVQLISDTLGWVFFFATIIPSFAICWRRNHDAGVSGWWSLLPFVNLYFWVQPSIQETA